MDPGYFGAVSEMWHVMSSLTTAGFGRFTGLVAREIVSCVAEVGVSPQTDRDTLELVLPMPFAIAMANASDPEHADTTIPPGAAATFMNDAATACRMMSNGGEVGLSLAIGRQAALAVLEGVDDLRYIHWAIYRSYVEVLLGQDPLDSETEAVALSLFQSALRVSGAA
jgi:hypothetical protein